MHSSIEVHTVNWILIRWVMSLKIFFLEVSGLKKSHKLRNNRSVMPLDVLGRTRATMVRL